MTSTSTPSRERAIGREVLSDPLLAEALAAFADTEDRKIPNAVGFLLRRVLKEWGWLAFVSGDYAAGAHLLDHRRQKAPDAPTLARVVPLERPVRTNIV
ncbi:MAG: hypothetical protein KBB14_11660 [Thermoanaerobaculia bacterium]|nr:hypothetical protein [Thermoanaerobaculia bacterium]